MSWKAWLRLIAGAAILGALIYTSDPHAVLSTVLYASPAYLAVAMPIYAVILLIYTARWKFILFRMGGDLPISFAFQAMAGGALLSDITPARVGDFLRPFMVKDRVDMGRCTASVVVDRYMDAAAASLVCTVGLLAFPVGLSWQAVVPFGLLISAFGVSLILWSRMDDLIKILERSGPLWLSKSASDLRAYTGEVKDIQGLAAISLLITFSCMAANSLKICIIALSLGHEVPVHMLFFALPLVGTLSMIPITVSGLGLVEGGMVALMMSLGVPASAGLSIALMDRAISMTYNVAIGGRYASGLL